MLCVVDVETLVKTNNLIRINIQFLVAINIGGGGGGGGVVYLVSVHVSE